MTAPNDSHDEMFRTWIDRDTAERMLAGRIGPR
jgi:hypothetical protein